MVRDRDALRAALESLAEGGDRRIIAELFDAADHATPTIVTSLTRELRRLRYRLRFRGRLGRWLDDSIEGEALRAVLGQLLDRDVPARLLPLFLAQLKDGQISRPVGGAARSSTRSGDVSSSSGASSS